MSVLYCSILLMLSGFETVHCWDFQEQRAVSQWQANAHLAELVHKDGALHGRAIDWDPFFTCSGLAIDTTASQCIRIRIKADKPGRGQLFWSSQTEGPHGGFDSSRVTDFTVRPSEAYQDIHVFPFWQQEDAIRQLRLDLYDGVRFEIAQIAVLERAQAETERISTSVAKEAPLILLDNEAAHDYDWLALDGGRLLVAPPLDIPVDAYGWLSFRVRTGRDTTLSVAWSTTAMLGSITETVPLTGSDNARSYHVELQGHRQWEDALAGLLLRVPDDADVSVERVSLAAAPDGPPVAEATYFGMEDALGRAGRPETVLARFANYGGGVARLDAPRLGVPSGVRLLGGPERSGDIDMAPGHILELRWQIQADTAGEYDLVLSCAEAGIETTAVFSCYPSVTLSADYVPPPQPVETSHDLLAYYFPGWNAAAKWECIRQTAPIRKPMLGYYDEANPECVDWQIKWAVENGIRGFLVDWYWVAGAQSLAHWFEAYRQSRYGDQLEVAIMWANHNPPGTHSREDWRDVTREWIEHYFPMDTYYRINGRPALFLWDANTLRNDLGGSAEVAAALAESQEMARAAGFEGIEFIVLQHHVGETDSARWQKEGYAGHTSYHEWGEATKRAPSPPQGLFSDVAETAPAAWEQRRRISGELDYYPVVDTGWDSRPWHGANAMAYQGRTVRLFRTLLEAARDWSDAHEQEIIILGPLNEWGEGSYIEPNLEFGFGMYEAVREVFGLGTPETWPNNISPRDVGLGPYDFPAPPRHFDWSFETDAEGWAALMNISELRVSDGVMQFQSTSPDPALVVATTGLNAADYSQLHIRMKTTGLTKAKPVGQLFWSIGDRPVSEATSLRFPLDTEETFHEYILDLGAHPRWRGRISMLRFDPCESRNAQVYIERITFIKAM